MAPELVGGQPPQGNKVSQLNTKVLAMAQDLMHEELMADTLQSCGDGDSFTSKFAGRYGIYETLDGEIIAFKPKSSLDFTLICEAFVATSNLTTIKMVARQLDDYELSVSE